MHPAYDGLAALPYYDEFDLSTVDVLLISQYVSIHVSPRDSGISCAPHLATWMLRTRPSQYFELLADGKALSSALEDDCLMLVYNLDFSFHLNGGVIQSCTSGNKYHHHSHRVSHAPYAVLIVNGHAILVISRSH